MYIDILSLYIGGIICKQCVEKLEKLLATEPGVLAVTISMVSKHAYIRYDEVQTSTRNLCKLISKAGYTPMILEQ